jgi:hypothetical protein
MELEDIRQDVAAFADSDQDVLLDKGTLVFQRNRTTYSCRLWETSGTVEVEFNGIRVPYIKFLADELGRLSILAEAIRQKRKDVEPYIDTKAIFTDYLGNSSSPESALDLMWHECESKPVGETKLIFLTADAGEGKTALLRRLTQKVAGDYLSHKAGMLLLHVDTQGRSFVRLEELVARDLGQLRISGVFYSGVIRLIRRGLLAIAIDGFDELLAEVGSAEAYSGLGAFLHQLGGMGVVVAAARSAYFEAENYTAQSRLLTSLPDTHVSVNQITLQKWHEKETVRYFSSYRGDGGQQILDPAAFYSELALRLGPTHPVLQRPFLVQRMAAILTTGVNDPSRLSDEVGPSGLKVVPNVIQAFLRREVDEKWRDQNGLPYLSLEQHVHLLAAVADEMWTLGKNSLPVEVIQLVTETVLEEVKIAPDRRVQVIERVKAHALLPPSTSSSGELTFDHEEFLNYFLAARLVELFKATDSFGLQRFCERHTLPAIVGAWTSAIENWGIDRLDAILQQLSLMARTEVRSTYLKQNAGLLTSKIVPLVCTNGRAVPKLDSMYFESDEWRGVRVQHAHFHKCVFIGVDFCGTVFKSCKFTQCQMDGLTYDDATSLEGSTFDSSSLVVGVVRVQEGVANLLRNYVPDECARILLRLGATFEEPVHVHAKSAIRTIPDEKRHALEAFFRIFSRNSGATDQVMRLKLGTRLPLFQNSILPALLAHQIVRPTEYRGRGQQDRFELNYPLDIILRAEDPTAASPPNLKTFWEELRK